MSNAPPPPRDRPAPRRAILKAQYRGPQPADLVRIVTALRIRSDSMDLLPEGGV